MTKIREVVLRDIQHNNLSPYLYFKLIKVNDEKKFETIKDFVKWASENFYCDREMIPKINMESEHFKVFLKEKNEDSFLITNEVKLKKTFPRNNIVYIVIKDFYKGQFRTLNFIYQEFDN